MVWKRRASKQQREKINNNQSLSFGNATVRTTKRTSIFFFSPPVFVSPFTYCCQGVAKCLSLGSNQQTYPLRYILKVSPLRWARRFLWPTENSGHNNNNNSLLLLIYYSLFLITGLAPCLILSFQQKNTRNGSNTRETKSKCKTKQKAIGKMKNQKEAKHPQCVCWRWAATRGQCKNSFSV